MPELTSHHTLKLGGEMTCAFGGTPYEVDSAILKVLFDEARVPYDIELHLNFTHPEQLPALATAFPPVQNLKPPHCFAFRMRAAVLNEYLEVFQGVASLEDWVTVAGGACFALDNYTFIGRGELYVGE